MINIMQLKAKIKNISKEKNISAQLVLQNYMMERFLWCVYLIKEKSRTLHLGLDSLRFALLNSGRDDG